MRTLYPWLVAAATLQAIISEHVVISDAAAAAAAFLPLRINTLRAEENNRTVTEGPLEANVTKLKLLAFFDLSGCGNDEGRVSRSGGQLAAAAQWAVQKLQGKWDIGEKKIQWTILRVQILTVNLIIE